MSRLEQRLIDGHLAAKSQRERLKLRLQATRDRLAPARLVGDLRTGAEQQVRATSSSILAEVKAHPARTALVGGAMLAWIFRHPLIDHGPTWLKRGYAAISGRLGQINDGAETAEENVAEPAEAEADDTEPCVSDTVQQNDSRRPSDGLYHGT